MLTPEQEKAIASLVDAAAGAVYALAGAKCFCHGSFVCTKHLTEKELAGAVDLIEKAFTGEKAPDFKPVPNMCYHWANWPNQWAPSYTRGAVSNPKAFAGSMASEFPDTRWAWTDESGQIHEVGKEAT